jgi:hypothetical protein
MRLAIVALASSLYVCPISGQISQSHPEFCGRSGGANPQLPNVSATFDRDGGAVLYEGGSASRRSITLTGPGRASAVFRIDEVCPLPDGRLVVLDDSGAAHVVIADLAKDAVDSFLSYWPVLSPDQRWIVYQKMYPLHGVEGSAEYLIYDLSKSAAQNRPDGDVSNEADVGAVIFPPGQKNVGGDNIGVPHEQLHLFHSQFSWAADSRAILFADAIWDEPAKIILVTLDDKGAPTAVEHEISITDLCGGTISLPVLPMWRMERAEVGADHDGTRSVVLDLTSDNVHCPSRILQLSTSDFKPTKTEIHVRPVPTHGAIVNGQEVVPPPKKK